MLGFHFSHAIDEGALNKLVGKKVQEALAKEKAKAKHQRVDKSAFFAGLGYSGMFSWNLAYKDSFVLLPHYFLIKDLNDSLNCAKKLLKLLNGIKSKVNLILFNPHEGSKFERPSLESARMFADFLNSKGLLCTIRESKALDIEAACGQLREKKLS